MPKLEPRENWQRGRPKVVEVALLVAIVTAFATMVVVSILVPWR